MEKWEYKVIEISHINSEQQSLLNQYGALGWELVCVLRQYGTVYLKRRLT